MKKRIECKGWAFIQVIAFGAPRHTVSRFKACFFKRIEPYRRWRADKLMRGHKIFAVKTGLVTQNFKKIGWKWMIVHADQRYKIRLWYADLGGK